MQKLSWKSIQEQFPKYATKYKNEFKELFTKSGKSELSIEDIDDYLTQETSLIAYKIGGYTRYFNDTAGRVLGRVEVSDNGDSQCYDTGGSLLGMVIGGQTFAANGVLLSPQDILATLLVKEDRVQASNKKASQECVGCDRHFNTKLVNNYGKVVYLCPNCADKEKEIVEKLIQPINKKSDQKNSFKNLVNWFKQASYYSEERSAKIIGDYIVELAEVYFEEEHGRAYSHAEVKLWDKEGKGEFKFKTPTKTKRFDTLQEAEEMYNKINSEEDFNLLDGKQAATEQVLYIDYAGGKFESWFYSEGDRYRFMESYDIDEIIRKAKRQEFNKFVLTEEAKMFRRSNKKADSPLEISIKDEMGKELQRIDSAQFMKAMEAPRNMNVADGIKKYNETHSEKAELVLRRSDKKADVPEQPTLFDINTVDEVINRLQSELQVPWKNIFKSTLGGDKNITIMIKVSLDAKDTWINGILHNSRYSMFSVDKNGKIEQFSRDYNLLNFRKTKAKSIDDLITKLNTYFASVQNIAANKQAESDWQLINSYDMGNDVNLRVYYGPQETLMIERSIGGKLSGSHLSSLRNAEKYLTASQLSDVYTYIRNKNKEFEGVSMKQAIEKQADSDWQLISTYDKGAGDTLSIYISGETIKLDLEDKRRKNSHEIYYSPLQKVEKFLTPSQLSDVYTYIRNKNKEFEGVSMEQATEKQADDKTFSGWDGIPFEMDDRLFAAIAGMNLSKDEIRDEATTAFENHEIDETDYNRIIWYLENVYDKKYEGSKKQATEYFQKGDRVEILTGSYKGAKGTVGSYNAETDSVDVIYYSMIGKVSSYFKSSDLRKVAKQADKNISKDAWIEADEFLRLLEAGLLKVSEIGNENIYGISSTGKKYFAKYDESPALQTYVKSKSSNKQADEQLLHPSIKVREEYIPTYTPKLDPAEWTSYSMQDIEYVDPLWDDSDEEVEVKQPSKYIPKKKQRGKYNLHEIVMTPEGRGRIVMKQVDYEPFSYTVALTGKDEITIVEEPQIQRLASINKQAKRNEALFKAIVYLDVWVDGDMIEYDDELVKIRKSNDSEDEKIKLAKERVTEIVRDAVYKVQIPDTESEVYINDVQIDKLDRDSKYDNIDYAALFPAVYDIPKEIDFRGYTGEPKQFAEDSTEYQMLDKLTDIEYESYDKQLRESGVDLSFKGEGMLLKKKGSKKSANTKEFWEMPREEFKQYLDMNLVPENWMEVMRDILSKIPYNTSIYITDLIKSPGKAYLAHPFIIQQALSEGKLIPAKVLADYPDLRKQVTKSAKSVGWLRDKFLNKIDKIADVAAEVNDEFKKELEDGEGRGISLIDYYTTGRYHEIEKPLSADAITKSQAEKLMEDLVYQFKTELFAIYNISSGAADKIVDEPKGVSMKDIEELEEATDKESAIEKEIEFYPMDSISTGYPSTHYLKDIVEPAKQPEGRYLSY